MNAVMYGLLIFIVICLVLMWYISIYNHYQTYIIRINEVNCMTEAQYPGASKFGS